MWRGCSEVSSLPVSSHPHSAWHGVRELTCFLNSPNTLPTSSLTFSFSFFLCANLYLAQSAANKVPSSELRVVLFSLAWRMTESRARQLRGMRKVGVE